MQHRPEPVFGAQTAPATLAQPASSDRTAPETTAAASGLTSGETELILGPKAGPESGLQSASPQAVTLPLTRHRRPLPALTGLRFLAAGYVVVFHTRVASLLAPTHPHLGRFFANGYLAVALFFLLSGFILAYTYRGQMTARRASARFWEARFARLWPAYAFSLLCSSLPAATLPTLPLMLATLCMVQAWNPWHLEYAGVWNFVCWTLSVEAFFYLLFPLLQRAMERLRPAALASVSALVLLVALVCNVSARTLGEPAYPAPFNHIPLPVPHLAEFLLGMALGNGFVLFEASRGAPLPRFAFLTNTGLLLSLALLTVVHGAGISLVLVPFSLLLAGLALERSHFGALLSSRPLLLGGAASYSMYLLQTPVRVWIHKAFAVPSGVLGLAVVPCVLLPFALLVYRLLEEPSRAGLRRLFAAAQRRPTANSAATAPTSGA